MRENATDRRNPLLDAMIAGRPKKASKQYLKKMQTLAVSTREFLDRGTEPAVDRTASDPPSRTNSYNVKHVPLSDKGRKGAELTLEAAEQEIAWATRELENKKLGNS